MHIYIHTYSIYIYIHIYMYIWDISQFLTRLLKHSLSPASILFRICIPRERNQHHVLCNKCHNCGVHPPFSDPDIRFLGFSLLWAMCPHCNNWYIPVKWSDKSVIFTTVTHISPSLSPCSLLQSPFLSVYLYNIPCDIIWIIIITPWNHVPFL